MQPISYHLTAPHGTPYLSRSRVLVIDGSEEGRVIAIDLDSGDRQVLSGGGLGAGPALSFPSGGALDGAEERLFVMSQPPIEVDLRTGNRVAHEDDVTDLGFPPTNLAFDAERGLLWGGSAGFTFVAVDPITDEVFLISH